EKEFHPLMVEFLPFELLQSGLDQRSRGSGILSDLFAVGLADVKGCLNFFDQFEEFIIHWDSVTFQGPTVEHGVATPRDSARCAFAITKLLAPAGRSQIVVASKAIVLRKFRPRLCPHPG